MKKIFKLLCPPIFLKIYQKLFNKIEHKKHINIDTQADDSKQDLEIYWSENMVEILENWGRYNAWVDIECLLINCKGKVLDIACGSGVNIKEISRFTFLDLYGFDISDLLIKRAIERGVDSIKVSVNDATKTDFIQDEFDYSYSIGSLEHFTEEGIALFLKESARYTSKRSFHMIPISENNLDNGWIKKDFQSYYNNSIDWWLPKFQKDFKEVYIIPSTWNDKGTSVGRWFICCH